MEHPYYLLLTGGAALTTISIARYMRHLRRPFLFLDAVGLVLFTVIGCNAALALDLPVTIVIMSGMITGCVGGVLCADIPLLLRAELYATVSVVTGGVYIGSQWAELPHVLSMVVAMSCGLTLRLLALSFGWSMPKFVYTEVLH